MHSTPVISKLYEPRQYFESPLLQTYSKLHGVIKKKKLKSFIQNLKNPGSNKKFFKFYLKGRLFVYYDDCPPKADSKPKLVVYIQEIQALEKAFKGKEDHLKIQLRNKEIELKFTSGKEMMLWHEALQFFRDCYSATPLRRIRGYKENVDVETLLDIAAENETEKWEQIKGKYDYTSFFKDKKLEDLFMLFPMGQISNRVLLGNLKKKTRWKKEKEMTDDNSLTSSNVYAGGIQMPVSPTTPRGGSIHRSRGKFFDQINSFKSKPYLAFLISQRPVNEVDEESYIKDHRAISKPKCLEGYNFNTIYLFDYSGPGDTRPAHKMLAIKFPNERNRVD